MESTAALPKSAPLLSGANAFDWSITDDSDEEFGINVPKVAPEPYIPPTFLVPTAESAVAAADASEPVQKPKAVAKSKAVAKPKAKPKAKAPAVHKFNEDGLFGMSEELFAEVPEEFKELHALKGDAWTERAYKCRARAKNIFKAQKKRFLTSAHIQPWQKQELKQYKLVFDRGTSRLGVCHYPQVKPRLTGYIGLSAALVDNCASAKKVTDTIVRELCHAALKGAKDKEQWRQLNYKMGGDGKATCRNEVTKGIVKHKVEVYCGIGGPREDSGHFFRMRMVAPARSWLRTVYCAKCWEDDKVKTHFSFKRV